MKRNISKPYFLAASSMLAISSAMSSAALAQSGNSDIEQVVVSASRISIAGYQQPTPVSVVGAAALAEAANADIGDTIRAMPEMGSASSPEKGQNGDSANSGSAGTSTVNLRNLGIIRNLILFDGQRVVQDNTSGGVDLSTIPTSLVQRVDVVTGGASAAWGSDAVSGVINLILNKSFTGFKASIDGTDTGQDNRRTYGGSITYGSDLDGGRAHFVFAGQYNDSPNGVFLGSAKWFNATGLFSNPALSAAQVTSCVTNASTCIPGQPAYVHFSNAGVPGMAGGAIIAGPLAGIQFTGVGSPSPYYAGIVAGSSAVGGSSNKDNSMRDDSILTYPFHQATLFGYASYRVTPDIQASLQLNYGNTWNISSGGNAFSQTNVIKSDNAYLDPTIAARMATLGLTSFQLSDTFTDPINMSDITWGSMLAAIGEPVETENRVLQRGVFSLDGALGEDWSWNAYYQHGMVRMHENQLHVLVKANLANAIDAVRVTAANVGASGLTVGTIACRSTLTAPANGCSPMDILGTDNESAASNAYVNTNTDFQQMVLNEDVAAGSMQGKLPWDLIGAGAPSVAFGAEYRKEGGVVVTSPLAIAQALSAANFGPLRGEYHVEEGFLEADVPLIKDVIVENLVLNAAGRMTSYSTSGLVETWKFGLTSQVNDDFRLRTTWSYDIRAPDLGELFSAGVANIGSPIDPKTCTGTVFSTSNCKTVSTALTDTLSNPNLQPEKSTTLSGGVVLTPHWVNGLSMSFDWYSINIKGYISSPSTNIEAQLCFNGNQTYCAQYNYGGPGGALSVVNVKPQNAASLTTSGLDFQADYSMDLFTGNLALRMVGNYTDEETEAAFGNPAFDFAGSMGSDSQFAGVPKVHFNLGATYTDGPWSGTVQSRYIGTARLNKVWTTGAQVDNNAVPAVAYLDLRASYKWNDNIQFYGAVDNVFDTPPPSVTGLNLGTASSATNTSVYDDLGRLYHAGIRFNF